MELWRVCRSVLADLNHFDERFVHCSHAELQDQYQTGKPDKYLILPFYLEY